MSAWRLVQNIIRISPTPRWLRHAVSHVGSGILLSVINGSGLRSGIRVAPPRALWTSSQKPSSASRGRIIPSLQLGGGSRPKSTTIIVTIPDSFRDNFVPVRRPTWRGTQLFQLFPRSNTAQWKGTERLQRRLENSVTSRGGQKRRVTIIGWSRKDSRNRVTRRVVPELRARSSSMHVFIISFITRPGTFTYSCRPVVRAPRPCVVNAACTPLSSTRDSSIAPGIRGGPRKNRRAALRGRAFSLVKRHPPECKFIEREEQR